MDGQRPSSTLVKDSTSLTLGGTKVLPNLTLTGPKVLLTAVKAVKLVKGDMKCVVYL